MTFEPIRGEVCHQTLEHHVTPAGRSAALQPAGTFYASIIPDLIEPERNGNSGPGSLLHSPKFAESPPNMVGPRLRPPTCLVSTRLDRAFPIASPPQGAPIRQPRYRGGSVEFDEAVKGSDLRP